MPNIDEPQNDPGSSRPHSSVLLNESMTLLAPSPGQCFADCTLGAGGHSEALIRAIAPNGRLIGLDVDPQALELARVHLTPLAEALRVRLDLIQANFSQLGSILDVHPHGILADLGVSSMQLNQPNRGFSFRFDQPLDMRMDPTLSITAADILRDYSEEQIADIIYQFGEEHKSRRIARAIVYQRKTTPINTTGQLEQLVRRALRVRERRRIHPATKTFQALRLAVNREMECLAAFLKTAPELLAPGGSLAMITFHSLEDRQVKQHYKALAQTGRFQQTVKFVRPGPEELLQNPRSRSAKLRVVKRQTLNVEPCGV